MLKSSTKEACWRFGLVPVGKILLDSELEPDSSGKPRLVTTVPQSGEASELLAATLEARAIEPKVLCSSSRVDEKERKREHQGKM